MSLNIDRDYYNKLDIEGFSLMMKNPSYCYKFYWLEAIVQLISEGRTEVSYDEIINEMITNAWFPVLEYHIHLSGIFGEGHIKDNLERAVLNLHNLCELPNNASKVEIKNQIVIYDKELHVEKMELTKNVPIKALSGFANKGEDKISLDSSARRMIAYYNKLNEISTKLPYVFGDENGLKRRIIFNPDWIQMIQDNMVSILGWIQYEKTKWLQNNNPEIPGLVYKLSPNEEKSRKLDNVRKLWEGILETQVVIDVFKDEPIQKGNYDVDHFIPWSFVMNDELWNLMPIDSSLNSSKSNKLPKWNPFFDRFASNQYLMYTLIYDEERPRFRKLYEACYRDNLHSIWANKELYRKGNSKDEFCNILEKNMMPMYESARRQGYEMWMDYNVAR